MKRIERVACHRLRVSDQYEEEIRSLIQEEKMKPRCLGTLLGMGLRIVIVVTDFIGIFSLTLQVCFFLNYQHVHLW